MKSKVLTIPTYNFSIFVLNEIVFEGGFILTGFTLLVVYLSGAHWPVWMMIKIMRKNIYPFNTRIHSFHS